LAATPISDTEPLTHYIYDSDDFTESTHRIDWRVFLPPKKGNFTHEFSAFRIEGMTEPEVWELGDTSSGRHTLARGDFRAPDVRKCRTNGWKLDIEPSEPPPRHASIIGWPPVEERDARKSLAQLLRADAQLVIRNS
jgi:hypothetical protein